MNFWPVFIMVIKTIGGYTIYLLLLLLLLFFPSILLAIYHGLLNAYP
ncbi:hypothetical protein ACMBCM_08970 [Spiroplasma sp. K1]